MNTAESCILSIQFYAGSKFCVINTIAPPPPPPPPPLKGVYWSEDKQTRNLVSLDPTNFEIPKIYQRNVQSWCRLAQLFLGISAVTSQKKSEIVGENFFPALKMQFGWFYWNIRKQMCIYKHSRTKIETSYIVLLLSGTYCPFVDHKYWKSGHYTFILVQLWAILCHWSKRCIHDFQYRKLTLNNIVKSRSTLK